MKLPLLIIIMIMVLAFSVRVAGLGYGLPFAYHDDEPIIVNYALAYGTGDFNPHVFKMSPFLSYFMFFIYGVFFAIGYIMRYFQSISDFAYLYLNNPTPFYIIGRTLIGVFCGTASVALIYLAGKRYFNKTTGLLAALFLALNYLHVRDSHYIYFDIPLTFFTLLFFLKANALFSPEAKRRDYIHMGIVFGLACSVKYSGALLGLPLALVLMYNLYVSSAKPLSVKCRGIFSCGASFIGVLFMLNPFSFLDFNTFLKDVTNLPFMPIPAHFHLKVSLINGCGLAMVAAGILGMLAAVLIKRNKQALLVVYAVFYYFIINNSSQSAERLVIPIVPVILMFAASLVLTAASFIKRKGPYYAITSLAVLVLIFPSLLRIYYSDLLFLREDTRTLAYNWIQANIDKGARIALDAESSWFPRLKKSRGQLRGLINNMASPQFDKPKGANELKIGLMLSNPGYPKKSYRLFYLKEDPKVGFLSTQPALEIDYASLIRDGIEYVVLSRMLIDDKNKSFVEKVEEDGRLLRAFTPYKEGVIKIKPDEPSTVPAAAFMLSELKDRKSYGPLIKIYRIR